MDKIRELVDESHIEKSEIKNIFDQTIEEMRNKAINEIEEEKERLQALVYDFISASKEELSVYRNTISQEYKEKLEEEMGEYSEDLSKKWDTLKTNIENAIDEQSATLKKKV